MLYEINVALNDHHFFATAERSLTTKEEMKKVYKQIATKFPESEGYSITVSMNLTTKRYLLIEELTG